MGVRTDKRKVVFGNNKGDLFMDGVELPKKDGIVLEKGAVINAEYLTKNMDELGDMITYWSAYPDAFLDLITPEQCPIKLFPYQRVSLRAMMRYKDVYITACRAYSKTFITILAMFLQCIFIPGHKCFICSPNKIQAAKVAREKMVEIYNAWPLLKREVQGWEIKDIPGNFGKDYMTINFKNGSVFDVKTASFL